MTNLDLGATFHVTDNFDIRVTTPITIVAMINAGRWSFIDEDYNLCWYFRRQCWFDL